MNSYIYIYIPLNEIKSISLKNSKHLSKSKNKINGKWKYGKELRNILLFEIISIKRTLSISSNINFALGG